MGKIFLLLLLMVFAVLNNAYTAETSVPLALTKAEKAIRNFLDNKKIKAAFIYNKMNPNVLYVKYNTKIYTVSNRGKDGKEYGKYYTQEGPKVDGFLWTIVLENATEMHQALMMQTSKYTYSKSFNFKCRFNNEKQFYNIFAFGEKSPLTKEIVHVLVDLDKPQDNLRIYIGNVNYKKQDIDIQIKLDGKTLINQVFKPKEPFITDYFSYKIPTGNHKLEISSSKIKTVTKEFRLNEKVLFFINCWNANSFDIQVKKYSFHNDIKVSSIDGSSIDFIKSEKGQPKDAETKLALVKSKIAKIEEICKPKVGASKFEVEKIFGYGIPTTGHPNGSKGGVLLYSLYNNRRLFVHYDNDVAVKAYYHTYIPKPKGNQQPETTSIEEQLKSAKEQLDKMMLILNIYNNSKK